MLDHGECDDAMNAALARGKDGFAMYLAARCDLVHGPQLATTPAPQATVAGTDEAASAAQEEDHG